MKINESVISTQISKKFFKPSEEIEIVENTFLDDSVSDLKIIKTIEINFNSPNESYKPSHFTKQEIDWNNQKINLEKISWHADYKR